MRADPDRAQSIGDSIVRGQCHVAAMDGDILGFAILEVVPYGQYVDVALLVVAQGDRRKGVGTRLLQSLGRRHAGAMLTAVCTYENWPARWMLEQVGFAEVGMAPALGPRERRVRYVSTPRVIGKRFTDGGIHVPTRQLTRLGRC